jgi:endonuclease VIII
VRVANQGSLSEVRVTYWCPHCQQGPGPNPGVWTPGQG